MTTESNVNESRSGTKSYRGRSLDEILPQIRAELGADAVILREREGLIGGVGGFFAQRFVEVEARRGDGQSIDVYDEGPDPELGAVPPSSGLELLGLQAPGLMPGDDDAGLITIRKQRAGAEQIEPIAQQPAEPEPEAAARDPREPRPFIPPAVNAPREAAPLPIPAPTSLPMPAPTPLRAPPSSAATPPEPDATPVPVPRRFETGIFMERLREASAMLPEEPPEPTPPHDQPEQRTPEDTPEPELASEKSERSPDPLADLAADIDADEAIAALLKARPPATGQRPPRGGGPARPAPSRPAPSRPAPQRQTRPRPAPQPTRAEPPAAQPRDAQLPASQRPARERPATRQPSASRPAPERPSGQRPQPRPGSLRRDPGARVGAADRGKAAAAKPHGTSLERAPLPLSELLPATLGRLFSRRHALVLKPAPAQPLDAAAAAELTTDLARRGASQAWTDDLVRVVGAHGTPLAEGLRAAAEAELSRRIVPAPALPAAGAAVAFIGAGGSGKTRCTAALASAYRRNSTLTVTVVALDNPDGARELSKLLKDEGVPVLALSGAQAKQAVETARHGGLVIVDTPAATPTDPAALESLRASLAPLELDATYVALPATLAPNVAKRALTSFGALQPAAVTITHVDETDQLAVVVEIAMANHIPLAYFHAGTDHRRALSAVNPAAIAQELLR